MNATRSTDVCGVVRYAMQGNTGKIANARQAVLDHTNAIFK
jgi:hypothetical protein